MTTDTDRFPFADVDPCGIINTYTVLIPNQSDGRPISLTYVLVRGVGDDVAVYLGAGTPEWIVRKGTKCSYRHALIAFPYLEQRWYRA